MATQIFFIFIPIWGRWTHFDSYFSGWVGSTTQPVLTFRMRLRRLPCQRGNAAFFFFWWDSLDKNKKSLKKSLMVKWKFCQANSVVAFCFINIYITYIYDYVCIYIYSLSLGSGLWDSQQFRVSHIPVFQRQRRRVVQESAADSLQRAGGSKMILPQ